MNFAIFYSGDAFTTDKKIMGRQNAGKTLMKGVARRWPNDVLHGFGPNRSAGEAMLRQLKGYGYEGTLRWRPFPGDAVLEELGAVYYPAPMTRDLAHARNSRGAASYSLFGVTHTLSSTGGMDLVADMVLPPFQPWDALICTSRAGLSVVERLQQQVCEWMARTTGAHRFNPIKLPVIPLGVDAPAFVRDESSIQSARQALGVESDDVAFLFAGRLSFHAKANPAPFYLALEEACRRVDQRLVCIEAGTFPNDGVAKAFREARAALAPSARFIEINGVDEDLYHLAWKAADVFASLSDNIQETFGITPVEAMAAGLPVLVSDWDGYKDTIRDGVDGYRIPVTLPPADAGGDLAFHHAFGGCTYDHYVGKTSMATCVDIALMTDRIVDLAQDPALRRRLGDAGAERARNDYDWTHILGRYVDLAEELREIRSAATGAAAEAWPTRPDPFALFADYPTQVADESWTVVGGGFGPDDLERLLGLTMVNYALDPVLLPRETILAIQRLVGGQEQAVSAVLTAVGGNRAVAWRCLMWLVKLGLVQLRP